MAELVAEHAVDRRRRQRCRHPPGQAGNVQVTHHDRRVGGPDDRCERDQVAFAQLVQRRRRRQFVMCVRSGPAVAREVLHHRDNPPCAETFHRRQAIVGDRRRIVPE